MNNFTSPLIALAFVGATGSAFAIEFKHDLVKKTDTHDTALTGSRVPVAASADSRDATQDVTAMDVNRDGKVSKSEFMQYQEGTWSKMSKGPDGMIATQDMHGMWHATKPAPMAHDNLRHDKDSMKHDNNYGTMQSGKTDDESVMQDVQEKQQ